MIPEVKEAWVEALRSDDYAQTRGYLCRDDLESLHNGNEGYCCLGVLCDVLGVFQKNGRVVFMGESSYTNRPYTLRHKLGLSLNDEKGLITLNDQKRADFDEIADYIEANL